MADYKKLFAVNLRKLRKARSLTQEQLATALGYSKKTVSKWECGNAVPDIGAVFSVSKVLQVSIDALFEEILLQPSTMLPLCSANGMRK